MSFFCNSSKLDFNYTKIAGATSTTSSPLAYPTSKPGKDWTAIEREIKEQEAKEKPVGEEALNKLFQDIYGKGDDNVKRAMNKSYVSISKYLLSRILVFLIICFRWRAVVQF